MKLRHYWQFRYLCRHCGEYNVKVPCKPRRHPDLCHHCQSAGLEKVAECRGKSPWFAPFVSKPMKPSADWVRDGNKRVGKSTGRPKKKPLDNSPITRTPPDDANMGIEAYPEATADTGAAEPESIEVPV